MAEGVFAGLVQRKKEGVQEGKGDCTEKDIITLGRSWASPSLDKSVDPGGWGENGNRECGKGEEKAFVVPKKDDLNAALSMAVGGGFLKSLPTKKKGHPSKKQTHSPPIGKRKGLEGERKRRHP